MNKEIYKDLDNLYESIESLNNKIKRQERELKLAYKGIEQLNNAIHNAIEYLDNVRNTHILSISALENILTRMKYEILEVIEPKEDDKQLKLKGW